MDIKVGEYVRTKLGKIDKVKNNDYYIQQYIECEKGIVDKENVLKHSFSLTDLIEVRRLCKRKTSKYIERRNQLV